MTMAGLVCHSPPGAPSECMVGRGTGLRWTHPDRKLQTGAVLACQLGSQAAC